MKQGSRILLFLVVVIIILIAVAFLVVGRGGSLFGTPTPTPPWVKIVVVGQPINRDDEITAEALTSMELPQTSVTEKMIRDPQTVVGKYALFTLDQGLPLMTNMIADRPGMNQPGSDAAKVIKPGLVAVSIPLTSAFDSVAYGIQDGDRINIIATTLFIDVDATFQSSLPNFTAQVTGVGFIPDTLPVLSASIASGGEGSAQGRAELDPTLNQALYLVPSEKQRARLVSQMILQDIQVLHVGDFSLAGQEPQKVADGQPTPTAAPAVKPKVITLIVTPQDAIALTYLMYSGVKFNLTLRAPDDQTRVETEAATLQYLLSQYAIPVPAKLPYVIEPRIQNLSGTSTTTTTAAP
jgi:Flp pilus assembly protein CpaB